MPKELDARFRGHDGTALPPPAAAYAAWTGIVFAVRTMRLRSSR
jgi:hypothetical protein